MPQKYMIEVLPTIRLGPVKLGQLDDKQMVENTLNIAAMNGWKPILVVHLGLDADGRDKGTQYILQK